MAGCCREPRPDCAPFGRSLERADPEAATLLGRALTSPDPDVRAWAVAALGPLEPPVRKPDLFAALEDRSASAVREAADALLRGAVDRSRELGPKYSTLLQACTDGAREKREAVAEIGPLALPVFFRVAQCEAHDVAWRPRSCAGGCCPRGSRRSAGPPSA